MNPETLKRWKAANKDKLAGYMRTWRKKHPATALANSRKWTEKNRQKTRDAANNWYAEHKDEVNARKREARKIDPEKYRERDRKRKRKYNPTSRKNNYLKHRAKYLAKDSEYYKRNKAARDAYRQKWDEKNREKKRAYSIKGNRIWRKKNPAEAKRRDASQYRKNIETNLIQAKRWRDANRHLRNFYNAKRRALKAGNGGSHTFDEWISKVISCDWLCFYCQCELTIEDLTKDHFLPLSRGGGDEIENVVPACLQCNTTKNAMTGPEFIQYRNS